MTTATATRPFPAAPNRTPPAGNGKPQAPAGLPLTTAATVRFGIPLRTQGHRIVLYGPGGIGKTTLAAQAPGPVAFIDLDDSLGRLGLEAQTVQGVDSWAALREALHAPGWDGIRTIVIDSLSKADELCVQHVFGTVPTEGGKQVSRLEDYGYKAGYRHVFDTFVPLLADLDAHCRAGRHVVLICHDVATQVPNPMGIDFLRWEPRLTQHDKFCLLRNRVKEWSDHVLAMLYDIAVGKDHKGQGSGTRTIYPCELPHCMAKSRALQEPVPGPGPEFWEALLNAHGAVARVA